MGVKGLLSFIKDNEGYFFTKCRLHNTKIIIDGSNFVHRISKIIIDESNFDHFVSDMHRFGGDYERLARKFKIFFNTMKKCNIAPYVVFDGGDQPDDRKLRTILEKKSERRRAQGQLCNGGLPILSYETVLKLLVELKIPHICCDFEADREIAVLAKRWDCPVFSNDSDFFVYGLQRGFVLLDKKFIDMKLRMHNTTSGTDTEIQPNYTLQENEFAYVDVKCCYCKKFVDIFHRKASSFILPVLATVMGNDYVDDTILNKFHRKLHLNLRNNSFKFQMSAKVKSILNWLTTIDSEENALDQVLVTLEFRQMGATVEENRQKAAEILKKSISEYKNIKEFESFDLEKEYDNQTSEVIDARNIDVSRDVSENSVFQLKDYYKRDLPTWLVNGMRTCEINGSFLQDVAVLHRVIFNCQVESVKQQSAYACSRDIRALIYGIVLNPCPPGDGESAENLSLQSVEEFDREEENEKREFVKPLKQIGEFTSLPTLETLISLSKSDRKRLLFAPLRPIRKNLIEQLSEMNLKQMSGPSQLMILIISHWFNHSQTEDSEAHISALIIGIIVLHVRALRPENKEDPLQFSPSAPVLFQEIENVIKSMNEEQVNRFKRRMAGYFREKNGRIDDKIVHSFAQFQSTLLDTLTLNQLLRNPVKTPSPSVILNCTFVYNLCRELKKQSQRMVYHLRMMLGMTSPLHRLFHSWQTRCYKESK